MLVKRKTWKKECISIFTILRNLYLYYSKNTTSVSIHFNLKHHDYTKHFSFFVYKNEINDLTLRLNSESFLLNLCKKLDVKLMNEHIPLINWNIISHSNIAYHFFKFFNFYRNYLILFLRMIYFIYDNEDQKNFSLLFTLFIFRF